MPYKFGVISTATESCLSEGRVRSFFDWLPMQLGPEWELQATDLRLRVPFSKAALREAADDLLRDHRDLHIVFVLQVGGPYSTEEHGWLQGLKTEFPWAAFQGVLRENVASKFRWAVDRSRHRWETVNTVLDKIRAQLHTKIRDRRDLREDHLQEAESEEASGDGESSAEDGPKEKAEKAGGKKVAKATGEDEDLCATLDSLSLRKDNH